MIDRLSPDAIIWAVAGSGWALERKKWQVIPEVGELLKLGLVCTNYYFKKYYNYLSNSNMPDLFLRDEKNSILITVEITTNPEKENLIPQLKHFLSQEYKDTVVDQVHHEVWLIVKADIIDKIVERIEKEKIKRTTQLVILTIDFDAKKGKYALKRVNGKHISELSYLSDLIPLDQPESFPWLSAKLSLPSILYGLGRDYFSQIRHRYPPTPLLEVYSNRADVPYPYKTFKDYIIKLAILLPELIKIDKMDRFSVKEGSPKVILDKLDEIRDSTKEALEEKIKEEMTKSKKKTLKLVTKKKITSYKLKTQTKLNNYKQK